MTQQSSSSAREEEEDHGVLMEVRRRRRVAFGNLAKEMLSYLDSSDDVKVGITELQERLEVLVQIGISIQQVAQQARSENGQKICEVFGKKQNYVLPAGPRRIPRSSVASCAQNQPLSSATLEHVKSIFFIVGCGASLGTARVLLGPFREKLLEWWKLRFESW